MSGKAKPMKNILIISSSPTKMIFLVANHFMVQSIWVHLFYGKGKDAGDRPERTDNAYRME